jgi:hypothetical protein
MGTKVVPGPPWNIGDQAAHRKKDRSVAPSLHGPAFPTHLQSASGRTMPNSTVAPSRSAPEESNIRASDFPRSKGANRRADHTESLESGVDNNAAVWFGPLSAEELGILCYSSSTLPEDGTQEPRKKASPREIETFTVMNFPKPLSRKFRSDRVDLLLQVPGTIFLQRSEAPRGNSTVPDDFHFRPLEGLKRACPAWVVTTRSTASGCTGQHPGSSGLPSRPVREGLNSSNGP